MQLIRWFVGTALVFFGRVAIWAGQTLFHLGSALVPNRGRKVSQRRSQSRLAASWVNSWVPYTVLTRDGRYVTMYGPKGQVK